MKIQVAKMIFPALALMLLINGCGTLQVSSTLPTETPTLIPTTTPTNTPAPTFTPTFTPTPIPVSIESAIEQGTFSEIRNIGKGVINKSIFSPDGSLFIAVNSRGIHIYETKYWQETRFIPAKAAISSIDISFDGKLFAAGDTAGNVTLWNTETWDALLSINAYEGTITSLKISPDGSSFVTVGDKTVISLWDSSNGALIQSKERIKEIYNAYYSADGKWVLTSEMNSLRELLVWTATDLTFTNRIPHMGFSLNLAVSPFTNLVASFDFGKLRIWDLDKNTLAADLSLEFGQHDNHITHWIFLSESRLVMASDTFDFYYLVNLETYGVNKISYSELTSIAGRNPRAWSITKEAEIQALGFEALPAIQAITSDGNTLILARGYPTPQIIGLMNPNPGFDKLRATEKEFNYLTMKGDNIVAIEWDWKVKQGDLVISEIGSNNLSIRSKTQIHYETSDTIEQVALSPDGSLLAIGTSDGALYLLDVDSKTQITRFQAHSKFFYLFGEYGSFSKIVFSPDGTTFATQGDDNSIKLWNAEDGKEIMSIPDSEYGDIAFSPSGKYFAYIGANNNIHIKSLQENIPIIVLAGDDSVDYSHILSLQFSSDESMLISGGAYQTVQIWSVADKTLLTDLPQSGYGTLSPDGTLLYVFTTDKFISVWGHNTQSE